MADHIIAASLDDRLSFIADGHQDFVYNFTRGTTRWACLMQYPTSAAGIDPSVQEPPMIYSSVDGGAIWTLQGMSAQIGSKTGAISLCYDLRFNSLDAGSQPTISFVYNDPDPTVIGADLIFDFHINDFTFATALYGTPSAALSITNPVRWEMSSRPDGSFVFAYGRSDQFIGGTEIGVFLRVLSGGVWGSEITIELGAGSFFSNMAVDQDGRTHIVLDNGNYYRVAANNSIEAGPIALPAVGAYGNLTITDNKLLLPYTSFFPGTAIGLLTGDPYSAPVWSDETAVAVADMSGGTARFARVLSASYPIALEEFDDVSADYTLQTDLDSPADPYLIHWVSNNNKNVFRVSRAAGVGAWSAPAIVWTATPDPLFLNQLSVRSESGNKTASVTCSIFVPSLNVTVAGGIPRSRINNNWDECLEGIRDCYRRVCKRICPKPRPMISWPWDANEGIPPDAVPFRVMDAITTPAPIDGDVQVLIFKVPNGYDGLIMQGYNLYNGGGFVQGSGDIFWRLKLNHSYYVEDWGNVPFAYGSVKDPFPFSDALFLTSLQTVQMLVNVPNTSGAIQVGASQILGALMGYYLPR